MARIGQRLGRCALMAPLVVTAVAGGNVAHATSASSGGGVGRIDQVSVRTAPPMHHVSPSLAATAATSIPTWTRNVTDGTSTFVSTMVGKDPTVAQAKPSTSIPTKIIPLVIKLVNGHTYDPTVGNSCDTTPAATRVMNSPIIKSRRWQFGATSVGSAQYVDAFQRANFATSTSPTGINPGYHVKLNATVLPAITVNVPAIDSAEGTMTCGGGTFGAVEINWLDNYLNSTVLPSLVSSGVTAKTFPLFLTSNVVEYINTTNNCCVLGYHSATQLPRGIQTYGVSMYDTTGVFTQSGANTDISVLSHEVAEWMDDPFVNNPTKPWGHIGQVSGCQNNLEDGDPLSGTTQPITMNGLTYHVQELAFASWFYHQNPSSGVNGWYSNYGTFLTAAAPCS